MRPPVGLRTSTLATVASLSLLRAPPPRAALSADDGGLHALLLQRSVQTCCFTARSCRDPPTAQWLSTHAGVPETYHGVDAFDVGVGDDNQQWQQWLLSLLSEPAITLQVDSVLKKNRGLSTNNPYLQPKPMTYSYELRPSEMAGRVMQTADSIAHEWVDDLGLMESESESVWRSRRAITLESDEEMRTTMPTFAHDPTTPGMGSPYRAGSYELLLALATRRAAESVLAALDAQPKEWAAREMLLAHLDEHGLFKGELQRHAADEWIAALLNRPISMRVGGASAEPALVDPRGIVEQILEWRTAVAREWIERLEGVSDALLEIKREHVVRASAVE